MTRDRNGEVAAMQQISARLADQFPSVPPDTITGVVTQVHQTMADAPVRDFIPILVEREAKKRLKTDAS